MTVTVSMKELLEAGVHFGHQARYWNPKMGAYIYGARQGIHIINLEETLPRIREAIQLVHNVASKRGKVMFVGTKPAARDVVSEEATRCGMPYVDYRWLGGMLTNYKTIRQSIKRLKELEEKLQNERELNGMTKKEILNCMREKDKLHANLSGIKNMGSLPDILFVIDVEHERIAIREANRLGIPVIGIVDTNSDPNGVDLAIPGNDDAVRAIRLYCRLFADTISEARSVTAMEDAKKEPAPSQEAAQKKVVTKKVKASEGAKESEESASAEGAKKPAVKAKKKAATEASTSEEGKQNKAE